MPPKGRFSPQGFSPEKRLRKRWQFRAFAGRSRVLRLSECTIYFIPNDEGHFRVGVTVRARTNSVRRNRVKRTIREFFRTHASLVKGFDFNVVIPPGKDLRHPFHLRLKVVLKEEFLSRWPKN